MGLLESMAEDLGLPRDYIVKLVARADYCYKEYAIEKRGGGFRKIEHPSRELKALQRWLSREVISQWPVHEAVHSYRRGRGILSNARVHQRSRYLLRLDIARFFPSLRRSDIECFLRERGAPGVVESDDDLDLFCRIVCRRGAAVIGAPTSPALSNALCVSMDRKIHALAQRQEVVYTRYADDLFFSTNLRDVLKWFPRDVGGILSRLDWPSGLRLNPGKTRHSSKRGRRRVTGIVLSSDGRACMGRKLKREIRSSIYRWDGLDLPERKRLSGLVAYAIGVEPDFLNALVSKYGFARMKEVRAFNSDTPSCGSGGGASAE